MSERASVIDRMLCVRVKDVAKRSQAWSNISIITALSRLWQGDYELGINNAFRWAISQDPEERLKPKVVLR